MNWISLAVPLYPLLDIYGEQSRPIILLLHKVSGLITQVTWVSPFLLKDVQIPLSEHCERCRAKSPCLVDALYAEGCCPPGPF